MLSDWLAGLRVAEGDVCGALRLLRVLSDTKGPEAMLLEAALRTGETTLTEVSAEGTVALLRVVHGGSVPLLIVDGEHVVGGKQDRIFNASFLVSPRQTVHLPVSCVERGRWRWQRATFESTSTTLAADLRAAKIRRIQASLDGPGTYDSNQHQVWRDVHEFLSGIDARSETATLRAAERTRAATSEEPPERMVSVRDQVGVVAVSTHGLVGFDVFGSASLFASAWSMVRRSLLSHVHRGAPPDLDDSLRVGSMSLRALASSRINRLRAPGTGDTLFGKHAGVTFCGLALKDVLYHLVGVPDTA